MHSIGTIRRSIQEEGRRAQIITSTIYTLAELGYNNASLAQIAKRAKISTSLILYHFKDKDDLIIHTLTEITARWFMFIDININQAKGSRAKLHAYIRSNLLFMIERPEFMAARIEIIFNTRNNDGRLFFQTESYDSVIAILEKILEEGIREKEFGDLPLSSTAMVIRASIDQFLGLMNDRSFDTNNYITDLLAITDRIISNESSTINMLH